MAILPTVKVKADTELGYMIINEIDLQPHHVKFNEGDEVDDKPEVKPRKAKSNLKESDLKESRD
jgi:hypothetical protein